MPPVPSAREFDQISSVYDETREPLEPRVVDVIAQTLQGWGIRALLEAGVGTGRISGPLTSRGLAVTGVDASRGMLARARAKGIGRLVRGSALQLPFVDRAFDAALFVHVLHLLDEPARALAEGCRVGRVGAIALVRPRSPQEADRPGEPNARRLVIDHLRNDGVMLPDRAQGGPPMRERKLLEEFPPERLVTVSEEDVTERLADQLAIFERRASRWTLQVPEEKLARAVAEAKDAVGERTRTYHQVRALALWERPPAGPGRLASTVPTDGSGASSGSR